MSRIAVLIDGYYVDFDDHCLHSENGEIITEINKRPLDVLEYLSEYPNCYKRVDDINNHLDQGCLSSEAIRGYIYKLRKYHPVLKEVVTHSSSGYKYIGSKITNINEQDAVENNAPSSRDASTTIILCKKTETEFESKYRALYSILINCREAFRNLDEVLIGDCLAQLQEQINDLFILAEKNKYKRKEASIVASSIVEQYNRFTIPYNSFVDAEDRLSRTAQKDLYLFQNEYNKLIDLVIRSMN